MTVAAPPLAARHEVATHLQLNAAKASVPIRAHWPQSGQWQIPKWTTHPRYPSSRAEQCL
eukprot:9544895-Alexandrium_andersonii.AAC.1